MTVANENMEWSITCDGSTESATGVVLDAYLYDDDEIEVILKTIATGAETTLTKTTDYTVTGVPGATAAVKTTSNYTSASAIYVRRTAVLSQTNDLVTGDSIPSEVIEQILDKDAMALQVIDNKAARGLQISKTSDLTDLEVVPEASKVFGMNATNDGLIMYPSTASGDADLADLLSPSGFGVKIYPLEVQVGSTGIRIISGTGSPEGVHTAAIGSLFLRTNGSTGTSLYRKESGAGNTGWVADSKIYTHDHSDADNGGAVAAGSAPATPVADTLYTESLVKAWGTLDGTGTPAWDKKYNFDAAVTDNGVGNYSVTFVTDMDDANYCVVVSGVTTGGAGTIINISSPATTGFTIECFDDAGSSVDIAKIYVAVMGTQ
jgi:hypothetical protein